MTLFSNSSMDYYPENKTSTFTVQLPRYMYLEGNWEVAMTEIQYPYTFMNVEDGENKIRLEAHEITPELYKWLASTATDKGPAPLGSPLLIDTSILPGYYYDIKDVISTINTAIDKETQQTAFFEFKSRANKVGAGNDEVQVGRKWIESCKLSPSLGLLLGYPPNSTIYCDVPPNTAIYRDVFAPHAVNNYAVIPEKMLIYCDILEPQIIGDTWGKVLGVISTNSDIQRPHFGQSCSTMFNPPQYIPVQSQNFEAIQMDIRDVGGRLMPFQYGTLSVKLHFRRNNYKY